jgi:hypothetical protein
MDTLNREIPAEREYVMTLPSQPQASTEACHRLEELLRAWASPVD